MNDLIELMNNAQLGMNIGRMKMNNLLFADDMMLVTKNKKHLQQLLNIGSDSANEWKLKVSPSKSKTLTYRTQKMEPPKLQAQHYRN